MLNTNTVIRRLYAYRTNKVLWEALYVNGKKRLEAYEIDALCALRIFSNDRTYRIHKVYESESDCFKIDTMEKLFPDYENFDFLEENEMV